MLVVFVRGEETGLHGHTDPAAYSTPPVQCDGAHRRGVTAGRGGAPLEVIHRIRISYDSMSLTLFLKTFSAV